MEERKRFVIDNRIIQVVYLAGWMVFTFLWLYIQHLDASPDEKMRYMIPQYIYRHGTLPHGADPEIVDGVWGNSYGFNPIISYIISAVLMKLTSFFTTGETALLIAARLVSLLFGAANVWIVMKISEKIFPERRNYQWLLIVLATLLPEAVFICSYVNVDAMALFAATLTIYIWILGMESGWKYRHCIALGISLSLCLLSYYNTYGFLVASFILFVGCHFMDKKDSKKEIFVQLLKKGLLVLLVVFVCSGWWFIRSYILYDGDFLGMKTCDALSEMYAIPELKPSNRQTLAEQGVSIFDMIFRKRWLASTGVSFIARFGYADIYIAIWMYLVVTVIVGLGLVGVIIHGKQMLWKEEEQPKRILFHWVMILAILMTVGISAYYSYTSDFQPQGRYCLPMLTALMYFVAVGIQKINEKYCKNEKTENLMVLCIIILFSVIALLSYFVYFLPNYR